MPCASTKKLNNKADIAATLCNIGIVYNSQKDYKKALEYIIKANKIDEAAGNKDGIAANLGNIGELYRNLDNQEKRSNMISSRCNYIKNWEIKMELQETWAIWVLVYTEQKKLQKSA